MCCLDGSPVDDHPYAAWGVSSNPIIRILRNTLLRCCAQGVVELRSLQATPQHTGSPRLPNPTEYLPPSEGTANPIGVSPEGL